MSSRIGPNIITDGLVLHLDAANIRSFRGEPTTNVVTNCLPISVWTVSNYQTSTATVTFETEDRIPHLKITSVTNNADYPRIVGSTFSSTITGTYSVSFEAKGTVGAQFYFRIYQLGSTKVTLSVTLTDNWQTFKFENLSTAFNLDQPYINPRTTGADYFIRKIQIEQKSYATPFVNGTRGTSVATGGGWKDLTNNANDGTLSSTAMTFDSDNMGSLLFDGTNYYVSIPNSSSLDFNSGAFSISFWMKANTQVNNWPALMSKSDGDMTDSNANGRRGWIFYHVNWSPDYWFVLADENTDAGIQSDNLNFGDLDTLTWTHITISVSLTSIIGYINGSSIGNTPRTRTGSVNATTALNIGRWATFNRCFNGNISYVSFYNRDLTAAEILQNYNALKSRYI